MLEQFGISYSGDLLVGVDEVGRGPLAGPVVAAAVILKQPIEGLTDSKKLTEKKREKLAVEIEDSALCYAIARVSHQEIDKINIFQATLLAMKRAIEALSVTPEFGAIDGTHVPDVSFPCQAIIKGDLKIPAISAASIIAKVSRDKEMVALDDVYPGYGFAKHKGYPTKQHLTALDKIGICLIHRRSYAPVRNRLNVAEVI